MKVLFPIVVVFSCCGCVWTNEYREVIVHKSPTGEVTGIDYKESLEQRDMLPWQKDFGTWLYSQKNPDYAIPERTDKTPNRQK